MIAKISATENLGGALGYNFRKVEKGDAEVILSKGLYQPAEGEFKMEEVLRDMQALLPQHCRTKKTVFHCSLNPHPDERLSDERLATLAEEYMQALGYGSQSYIVFKHHDIEREHIHIVSLRVNEQGEKINDGFYCCPVKVFLMIKIRLKPSCRISASFVTLLVGKKILVT